MVIYILSTYENENTNYNLWNVVKIVLREIFVILNSSISKHQRWKIKEL